MLLKPNGHTNVRHTVNELKGDTLFAAQPVILSSMYQSVTAVMTGTEVSY